MTRAEELAAIEAAVTDGQNYHRISLAEAIAHDQRRDAERDDWREAIRAGFRRWSAKPPQT